MNVVLKQTCYERAHEYLYISPPLDLLADSKRSCALHPLNVIMCVASAVAGAN